MGKQPLGIELVKRGTVTGADIEKALKYQETHRTRKIGDILYIQKVADPQRLIKDVSEIIGKKGIYLQASDIKLEPTEYIPFDVMKKNKCIPFDADNGKIKVAFADIDKSDDSIKSIKMLMLNKGLVLEVYFAFQTNVEEILERYDTKSKEDLENISENETVTETVKVNTPTQTPAPTTTPNTNTTVTSTNQTTDSKKDTTVATGDTSKPYMAMVFMGVSIIGMAILTLLKKKED